MDAEQTEKIEAYLSGQLSEAERQAFEKKLAEDEHLQAVLLLHQKMMNAIQETEFRDVLLSVQHQKKPKQKAKRRWIGPVSIGIAASVVLLIGAFWILLPNNEQKLEKELANIVLDPGLPTTLSSTNTIDFGEGMNAYKRQDYSSAKNYWQPLFEENPANDTLLFYLAQIDLATGKNLEARDKLNQLKLQTNSIFLEKTDWYLAIAFLRSGFNEEGVVLLENIKKEKGIKEAEAEALLKYLQD